MSRVSIVTTSAEPDFLSVSTLLAQIEAERASTRSKTRSTNKGAIQPIAPDEIPFELPASWKWVRLKEIADSCLGKMLDKTKNRGTPRPYLRNVNVRWLSFELSDVQEMRFEDDEAERYSIRKGDLVMCEGGEPGRCAVWESDAPMFFQKALHRIRPLGGVDPHYLAYWFYADAAFGRMSRYCTGTGIKHLVGEKLTEYPIPLPPIHVQRHIVKRLATLFAEIGAGVDGIHLSQERLDLYKQAILDTAIRGRLIPQDPNEEPATNLLERIRSDKEALVRNGKLRKEKELSAAESSDTPFELPAGWAWSRIQDICKPDRPISYGVIKLGQHDPQGVPVLRSSNVRSLSFELDEIKYSNRRIVDNYKRTYLEGDEVLITIRGTLGGVCVATKEMRGWNISREVALLSPCKEILPEFLAIYLASPTAISHFKARLKGIAYVGINLEDLRTLPIPVPPRIEQKRIVTNVMSLLGTATALASTMRQQEERAPNLRCAILKSAFEGKLV